MRAEALRRRDLTLPHLGLDFDSDDEADALNELSQAGQSGMEYHVPSTGACVTLSNAKSLLFYFCNKLPSDRSVSASGLAPSALQRCIGPCLLCLYCNDAASEHHRSFAMHADVLRNDQKRSAQAG